MKLQHKFYVYEDWTLEEQPRPFYVGKGKLERVFRLKRSKQHQHICELYGQRRMVVLETYDESEALEYEKERIKENHTHPRDPRYNGIGCNKTTGGQGNSGRIVSLETCKRISDAKKGKKTKKVWTQKERDDTSKRMSLLHKGRKLSDERKATIRKTMNDPIIKNKMKKSVSKSLKKKYEEDNDFYQHIVETRVRGEQSKSPFTNEEILQIRREWNDIDKTIKGTKNKKSPAGQFCQRWADFKNISYQAVYAIVIGKTWKHLL